MRETRVPCLLRTAFSGVICLFISANSLAEIFPSVKDDGILHDFHKTHIGKVVFAKKEIPRGEAPSEDSIVESFSINDRIYLRAYLPMSGENMLRKEGKRCYEGDKAYRAFDVRVNGGEVINLDNGWVGYNIWAEDTLLTITGGEENTLVPLYDGLELNWEIADADPRYHWVHSIASQMKRGKNQVEFIVYGFCPKESNNRVDFARSTVTVNFEEKDYNNMVKRLSVKFPKNRLPQELQSSMRESQRTYAIDGYSVKSAIATEPWRVEYNEVTGIPIHRTITGLVFFQSKKDSKQCSWQPASWRQQAIDKKNFAENLEGFGSMRSPVAIACSAVP